MSAGAWFLVLIINGVAMATGPHDRAQCKALADAVPRPDPNTATAWCVHRDRVDAFREEPDYGHQA